MEKVLRRKIPYQTFIKLFLMFLTIPLIFAFVDSSGEFGKPRFVPEFLTVYINWSMPFVLLGTLIFDELGAIKNFFTNKFDLSLSHRYRLLTLTKFLFSTKTQKEIFEPAMADWDVEIYDALKNQEKSRLLIINLRNIYGFAIIMWMKSPIGDLIEFVCKLAK